MGDIGTYDRRIKFCLIPAVEDGNGDFIPGSPVLVKELWAKVVPLSSSYFPNNSQVVGDDTTRFEIRYNPDFMPTKEHVILVGLERYGISEIIDVNDRHVTVRLTATLRRE